LRRRAGNWRRDIKPTLDRNSGVGKRQSQVLDGVGQYSFQNSSGFDRGVKQNCKPPESINKFEERRLAFWAGSLFVATLVVSRFFEYESSLLLKSAAFMVCGAVTMLAGVAYEKFLHRREATAQ
jgi:hypothetical protein